MGAQDTGRKVKRYSYPSFTVYFNKANEHIYHQLMAQLERGQISQWVIDACLLRLQEESLTARIMEFLGSQNISASAGQSAQLEPAKKLVDSFGDFDA